MYFMPILNVQYLNPYECLRLVYVFRGILKPVWLPCSGSPLSDNQIVILTHAYHIYII